MYTTLQLSPSKHVKQKEQEFYIAQNNSTNNSIALTRFLFLLSPLLPILLNDWSCPHKQCNLLSVYSSNPLWVEVNLTYPTDRSCVHSTDHCSWRAPQKTKPLILIGVKGANIFVITLEGIGASFGTLAKKNVFFSPALSCQYLCICMVKSMKVPQEKEKSKLYLAFRVFSPPTFQTHKEISQVWESCSC